MTYTYARTTSTFELRRHTMTNPVTSAVEAFIALDSPNREWTVGTQQTLTLTSATNPSTTEASPDGLTTAKLIQNTTATNTHGVSFSTSQAITNGEELAMLFVCKAGTLTKLKVYFGAVATTPVVATFNISTGSKISGDSRLKIRSVLGQAGWYEIYSVGVVKDANISDSNVVIRALKESDSSENYTGSTSENWYFWKYGLDWDQTSSLAGNGASMGRLYDSPGANASNKVTTGENLIIGLGATLSTPQTMSVYMEWIDRSNALSGANRGVFRIGDLDGTNSGSLEVVQTSTGFEGTYENAAGTSISNISLVPTEGQLVGLLATLDADGALQVSAFVNSETAVVGTAGTARGFATPWSDANSIGAYLTVNSIGGLSATIGDMYLRRVNLYSGVADLAALRA